MRAHYASPSESCADALARCATPPLDLGVPVLAGRVRAGDAVEVVGGSRWLLSELMSHMLAHVIASSHETLALHVFDVQRSVDAGRACELAQQAMAARGLTDERPQWAALQRVRLHQCDWAVQLLCSLRALCDAVEARGAGADHVVVFVDGLTNLFWQKKQVDRHKRAPLETCMDLLLRLVQSNAVVVVTKLVLFRLNQPFDEYYGRPWDAAAKTKLLVQEAGGVTAASTGKSGARAAGYVVESSKASTSGTRHGFTVTLAGGIVWNKLN